jgi:hypothetical protein
VSSAGRLAGVLAFAVLATLSGGLAGQEARKNGQQSVRVFSPSYRTQEELVGLIQPLLSEDGSIMIQPRTRSITVKDRPAVLDHIAKVVAAADLPPRALELSVTLLRAGSGRIVGEPAQKTQEMATVRDRLKKLFSFDSYSILESVSFVGIEGNSAGFPMGKDFRLDFRLGRSTDDSIAKVADLVLSRLREENGKPEWKDVLRTSINVAIGQPFVLGVGKDEAARGALFLVFQASPVPPGPGIGGVRR